MKEIHEVKEEVERVSLDLRNTNPIYIEIFTQKITLERLSIYTDNLTRLVRHTPLHLNLAEEVSLARGRQDLAKFFQEKMVEEEGHDKWGEQDLESQRKLGSRIQSIPEIVGMTDMINYNKSIIEKDPTLYLAYIFFAEYETVLNTPFLLEGLNKSSLPNSVLSILGNHAELDKEHVGSWQDEVAHLVNFETYKEPFKQVIREAANLYNDFCNQCCEEKYDSAA